MSRRVPRNLRGWAGVGCRLVSAAAAAILLAACSDGDYAGAWAPDAAACAPDVPGRIVIGGDFFEETTADIGPRRVFAIVRSGVDEAGAPRLMIWFEIEADQGSGIFRWTFEPLPDGRLSRIEVAVGAGHGYRPVERPGITYVRCPDAEPS